jgi:quinolinate synthase
MPFSISQSPRGWRWYRSTTPYNRQIPARRFSIIKRIKELAKKRNAIILAHNYQPPEIQDLADMCGDSLELSRKAARPMPK